MKAIEAKKLAEKQIVPKAQKEVQDLLNLIKCRAEQGELHVMYVPTAPDNVVDYALKTLTALGYKVRCYIVAYGIPQYKISW